MRHALVTGATGGLGRTVVPILLAENYRVTATGRSASIGETLGTRFVVADLASDPLDGLVEGVDTVFHLAALSSPWGRETDFVAANVVATDRLLSAARRAGVARFVFTSTPSIYADTRDHLGLTEADPPTLPFANAYAETKYRAERAVLAANGAPMASVVLRPRAIVGRYDTVLLPRLMRAVRGGRVRLPRRGNALIEITDARDVAAALITADRTETAAGRVFNISGGAPRPLRSLLETIFGHLGQDLRISSVGPATAMAAATLAEFVARLRLGRPEPPLTRYAVKTLAWSQSFDLRAAREVLGWQPRITPEAAIAFALGKDAAP